MSMKLVSLPYKMEEMQELKEQVHRIDMSQLNFPSVGQELQERTAFIFLRNTGFNAVRMYVDCSYERKEKFLQLFLFDSLTIQCQKLAVTWITILNYAIGNDVGADGIFSFDEIQQFIVRNEELIIEVFSLVKSLPVFSMYLSSLNNEAYNLDEIPIAECKIHLPNFVQMFPKSSKDDFLQLNKHFLSLFDAEHVETYFYTNIFHLENYLLIEACDQLPFSSILYGLCTEPAEKWIELLSPTEA